MKKLIVVILLSLVVLVGCAPKEKAYIPREPAPTAPPAAPAPEPEVSAADDVSQVEVDVGDLDDLTAELDISELDSLDQELAELDLLELG